MHPIIFLIFLPSIFTWDEPAARTPEGKIIGTTFTTRLGRTVFGFRGIRYAKAPVNELRFQPPQLPDSWSGVYDATRDGPVCPQEEIEPSNEDCLFLNVYTPQLPRRRLNHRLPVIVYIHPGGYVEYTGRSNWVGPEYLLDENIVLVTINYRLGVLGFISTGTKEAPGNLGLKDQVQALKWVKENILYFGGNPDLVTIYGYSAGSASVILHLMSPMSKGLFHRAICASFSPTGGLPFLNNLVELTRKQAKLVKCRDDVPPAEILECFKTIPAKIFGKAVDELADYGELTWQPVIEKDFGQERFLTEDPIKLAIKGQYENVPLMIGITKDEFAAATFFWIGNQTNLEDLNENFYTIAPLTFFYDQGEQRNQEITRAIRKFYLGDGPINNSSLIPLGNLYADSITGFPINRAAKLLSARNTKPVYYYEFTYQGRYSYFYVPGTNNTVPFGVAHHDDLMYLFYISTMFPKFFTSDPESKIVDRMTKMWANFARTGNPTPDRCPILDNVSWEPFTAGNGKYMDIGSKLRMKTNLFAERYNFWENLLPLPSVF